MTTIWEDDLASAAWSPSRRLSAAPDAVAALVVALHSEPHLAGRLVELRLAPRPEHTRALYLTGRDAATGLAVFVKMNVSPWELHWMRALGAQVSDLVPQVLASGAQLGGYAVAWLVLERVPYQLLDDEWGDRRFDLLAEAAVSFQVAAQGIDRRFTGMEGFHSTKGWIEQGLRAGCPGPIARVLERLHRDWDWVARTCSLEVCFGDLTPVNALSRTPPPGGESALLIDPIPRVAPWAWDGAYCQSIAANSDVRMIHRIAERRRRRGLHTPADADLDRLAALMLAWLGALWWGIVPSRRDDGPWRDQIQRYVEAAVVLDLGEHAG